MVRNLAHDLSRHGVETHVVTTNDNGAGKLGVPCGVPVLQKGVTYWYFPRQTKFYTFSWPLGAWLARHVAEYNIVHIHALFSFPTLPAAFWAWRYGVPYIVRPLGTLNEWGMKNRRPWLKRLSFRVIESRVLKHAARIHYTSDQERLEAETLDVTTAAAVIPNVVPNGPTGRPSYSDFRARHPQLHDRRIVLFLSRLDPKKGLDILLQAFAHVRARVPDAALVVAGNGDHEFVAALKGTAASLGIGSDVVWPGFLGDDEKQAALAEAELFVLPSYSENFGNAVGEALAAGVPVIVSDRVGIHGDVTEAGAGLVVPCDVEKLAAALIRLLEDARLRATMGNAGRALARQRYSSSAVTRQLIAVYDQIAG